MMTGTADSWRERLHDMLKSFVGRAGAEFNTDHIDEDAWARLADAMTYISGDLTKPDLYEDLRAALDEVEKAHGTRGNAIFYRGPVMNLAAVKMDFHYDDWFTKEPNVGYETLLYDVMIGDDAGDPSRVVFCLDGPSE
jgi:glucose-6-phosphate 1-dehydrogenase